MMNRVESILADVNRNEFAGAEAYIKKHTPKNKSQRDHMYRIALSLTQHKNHPLASLAYQKVLQWSPGDGDCIARLASAHLQCGRYAEALQLCAAALASGQHLHSLYASQAAALIHLGQWEKALAPAVKAIEGQPANAGYFELLGTALMQLNRDSEAIAAFRKALEIDQYHVSAYASLATLFYRNKKVVEAARFAQMALKLAPENLAALRVNIELALADNAYDRAEQLLAQARRRYPADLSLKRLASYLLINEGKIDDANQLIDELIESGVIDPGVLLSKTLMSKGGNAAALTERQLASLVQMVDQSTNTPIKLSAACFAISNHYQAIKDYGQDYAYLVRANELTKNARNYQPGGAAWLADTDKKITLYTPAVLSRCKSNIAEQTAPVFIIGMPRSGSTLVEQVLDAHPALVGLGEVDYLKQAIESALAHHAQQGDAEGTAACLSRCFPTVAQNYLAAVNANCALAGRRFVDKMLLNYQSVNYIVGAFPEARLVHVKRHPLDNCLAMYRRLFQDEQMNFTTDLKAIGDFYIAYRRLMTHWLAAYPGLIHEIQYEQLVTDTDSQIRQLLDYCNLPWDNACAQAHLSGRRVKTASVVQVRQPIYQSALGRWQHYANQLEPLRLQLTAAGIDC